jgi:Methyltransferase domain
MTLRRRLSEFKLSPVGALANIPRRVTYALGYYVPKILQIFTWGFRSREDTNYTYGITDDNRLYLAHTLSVVTGVDLPTVAAYLEEPLNDVELKRTIETALGSSKFRFVSDPRAEFGRRLGWYAFVRILKPKVVIETGVDKGHGAVLLCSALLKNRAEGFDGKYFGTDINPDAGWLLRPPYDSVGKLLIGDSIQSLRNFEGAIDLFINDSDHSAIYEYQEYQTVLAKLSNDALILGDNSHESPMLPKFAAENGMRFLYFREVPRDHWYPGGGIGIAFR